MSDTPGLPVSPSGRSLTVADEIALVAGDVLAKPTTGERLAVLKIEGDGIIYYSSAESDYGYYPGECLREDFDGVGNDSDPLLELVDEDQPNPLSANGLPVFSVTVWTQHRSRTIPGVSAVETEFGDTNTIWVERPDEDPIVIETVGAVVEGIDPQPRVLPTNRADS